jgi:hypothetical protein
MDMNIFIQRACPDLSGGISGGFRKDPFSIPLWQEFPHFLLDFILMKNKVNKVKIRWFNFLIILPENRTTG